MNELLRRFACCVVELYMNYFIPYIPCWTIRKLLYRLLGMKIGRGTHIAQRVHMFCPWRICIGENTMVNAYAILDGRGGLEIGSNCSISMRAVIYTASHLSSSDTFETYKRKTTLGDCSWIGVNAVILPGANVGHRAIVSANSVLKGDAMGGYIYMGIPAVQVRKRELDKDYRLDNRTFFM